MAKSNLKTLAYNSIRQKIVTCEYSPGSFLNEEMLTKDLGLSRTPVRDALSRLEQEGLVEIHSKKGIMVTPFSINTVNMIFEVRLLYEPYFLLNYGNQIPQNKLEKFFAIFLNSTASGINTESNGYFFEIDSDFHLAIVEACPNIYLRQNYYLINAQNDRLRRLTGSVPNNRVRDTFKEHLDVLRPCFDGDWKLAADKLAYHLEQSKKASFQMIISSPNQVIPL